MTSDQDERLVTAQERQAAALERIAISLAALADVPVEPPPPPAPVGCQHPLDKRIDFGETGGRPDWQCRPCGYRSITEPAVPAATTGVE